MTFRAFYAELGVELPAWSAVEAPVRCFAQPEAHRHGDRTPSCSVNLSSGAWNCHSCGARGGAYDAALASGHSPRSAIDLMIVHGLAERRSPATSAQRQPARRLPMPTIIPPRRRTLDADEVDVRAWVENLDSDGRLVRRLMLERAWAPSTMRPLGIGLDGARITIPIRDARGQLRGILRYDPFGRREPKMLAMPGTRLGLIPHPAVERSERVILTEGPPDMIAARSAGLAAIAVPGTEAWQPRWARLLAGRRVTVVMDCDPAGRRAAEAIARSLAGAAAALEVVDLSPDRSDGYDLTDRLLALRRHAAPASRLRTSSDLLRPGISGRARQEASR